MPGNTKQLKKDVDQKPAPQYFDPVLDEYGYLYGSNGAARHIIYGADGQPVTTSGNKLAVRATEIETMLTTIEGYIDGLEPAIGTPAADPAANTILARLKTLATLIGEVQAAPTANTLLARLKNLETKVDAIIADGLKLSGSNIPNTQAVPNRQQNKVVISTILNAVSVPVYDAEDLIGTTVTANYTPDGASEIYLAVNIDKQPWSANAMTWTGYSGSEGQRTYPFLKDITHTSTNSHNYKLALIYSEYNPIETVDSYEKALRAAYYPETEGIVRIWNKHATDVATVTIKMIKVWRNR